MSKYGDLNFDEDWYDEPLQKYLDYKRDVEGVTEVRFKQIQSSLVDSPDNSNYQVWDEFVDWRNGMTTSDARDFLCQLRDAGLAESTVENKMRIVQSFLKELLDREAVESNPVAYVLDEVTFNFDEQEKIDRSVDEIGAFLQAIPDLQQRAMGTTFSKTGIRKGENHNIDLPFLHLDHEIYDRVLDQHDVTLIDEVADYPDALYIPSEPTVGEEWRGETRQLGNKRKRGTPIPIDSELKTALLDWLAVRPETAYPHPLWVSPEGQPTRIGVNNPNLKLTNHWAEETGLVDDGDTGAFTPHWFRHFFTTNMQPSRGYHGQSIPPTVVKYLRGDVGSSTERDGTDTMDVYTHEWGEQVKRRYLNNIYQFGIYD